MKILKTDEPDYHAINDIHTLDIMTGILRTDLTRALEHLDAGHPGQTAKSEKTVASPFPEIIR